MEQAAVAIRGNRIHRQGHSRSKEAAGAGGQTILTARERDVLSSLARGYSYAEIATRLGISLNTVTTHIKNSYRKLGVHSGPGAVMRAADLGLLRPGDGKGPPR
jgi:DNA-binding CsgD family transcriptional regulator